MNSDDSSRPAIRSFVKRSGRLTPSQKNGMDNYWPLFGLELGEKSGLTSDLFDGRKVNLEIGIGNGDAIITMAKADPLALYLGIEVHEPGIGRCLNNINKHQLDNVRLFKDDAMLVLEQMFKPASLDRVMLFFPDPWHKKRHHKRRIVKQVFRDILFELLKTGGEIHMATDWEDYAVQMSEEFCGDERFISKGDASGRIARPEYRPQTHFERRGLKLGHGVWDLIFQKV